MLNLEEVNKKILQHEKKILFVLVLVCALQIIFFAVNTPVPNGQDTFWYMKLANSLVSGKGYSFDGINPHSQYPPGLSILLIPFLLIFKNAYIGGLVLIGILSLLALLLTYKVGKLLNPLVALTATILLLFHNLFISFTTTILTEIPFMVFSLLGLYLFIKGFENKKLFLYAFPVIAFSCLIRYDGFMLIFPMIYCTYLNRKKVPYLIKTDSFIIGIVIGSIILGAWFLRNLIAFGNPLYTNYTNYDFGLGFSSIYSFAILFFNTGFLFPIFAIIGAYFVIKKKNIFFTTMIVWFFSYLIIHSVWGSKLLRFYSEILPIISIFCVYGIIEISRRIKNKKRLFFSIIVLLIIFSQIFLLFSPNLGTWGGTSVFKAINQYSPIKDACEFANANLPDDAIYIVSDPITYSFYLDKTNIVLYNQGINSFISNPNVTYDYYIIVDKHHAWITAPYFNASNGSFSLNLQTNQGQIVKVKFNTELVSDIYYNKPFLNRPVQEQYAYVVKLTGFEVS